MPQTRTQHRVRLNETAYEHAKRMITEGRAVIDERDDWSEHQPTAEQENEFIRAHAGRPTPAGTSGSTRKRPSRPRRATSSRTATSRRSIAAASLPRSRERPSTTTPTSRPPPRTCTECLTS